MNSANKCKEIKKGRKEGRRKKEKCACEKVKRYYCSTLVGFLRQTTK